MASGPDFFYRQARRAWGLNSEPALYYVVPDANWVTDWVGRYVVTAVTHQFNVKAQLTTAPHLLVDHIIHYGEAGAFLASLESRRNRQNTLIATIFHGNLAPQFPQLTRNTEKFLINTSQLTRVVTACRIMENRLLDWGVPAEKVVCLPLGVDLAKFRPATAAQRQIYRSQIDVPQNAFCVGSFQKDGAGWGEGLTPKLVKGPDVFLAVMARVFQQQKNLFVLLTGPARGYVKQGLDKLGIPYRHQILENYHDVVTMYHCLDAYLVASREEGGPNAVLESLACGVPLVSTRVGTAPDVITHDGNGLLADVDDVAGLAESIGRLADDQNLGGRLALQGLADIQKYDWSLIGVRYYRELYAPIFAALKDG